MFKFNPLAGHLDLVNPSGAGGGIAASLSGNTSGVLANISTGTMYLAGGNNITLSQNGNSVTISGANAGGAQTAISGISAGTAVMTSGTAIFSNSNGISFGVNGNTITASHNGITQQSTQPVAASASNGSFNFSTLKFVETNGVTWATSTDGIRASVATNYQSQGAYLTTAMVSDAGSRFLNVGTTNGTNASITLASNNLAISVNAQSVQPVAASASNGSFNFSTLKFVEGSGVTWATQAGGIQASVKTDYQSSNAGPPIGQKNPSAKLTENIVIDIRNKHLKGESIRSLAKKHKVARNTVKSIVTRVTWKHV